MIRRFGDIFVRSWLQRANACFGRRISVRSSASDEAWIPIFATMLKRKGLRQHRFFHFS